jgi:hypothetical protein
VSRQPPPSARPPQATSEKLAYGVSYEEKRKEGSGVYSHFSMFFDTFSNSFVITSVETARSEDDQVDGRSSREQLHEGSWMHNGLTKLDC